MASLVGLALAAAAVWVVLWLMAQGVGSSQKWW